MVLVSEDFCKGINVNKYSLLNLSPKVISINYVLYCLDIITDEVYAKGATIRDSYNDVFVQLSV